MANRLGVYTITEREGQDKGWWTRIGTAFENRDGSLNVLLDALPVNGKIHIREEKRRDEDDEGESERDTKRGKSKGKSSDAKRASKRKTRDDDEDEDGEDAPF